MLRGGPASRSQRKGKWQERIRNDGLIPRAVALAQFTDEEHYLLKREKQNFEVVTEQNEIIGNHSDTGSLREA